MRGWLRVTMPPSWALGALFIYGVIEILFPETVDPTGRLAHAADKLLSFFCIVYGGYRGIAFHPAYRPEYRRWLVSTPWRLGLPLPVGPIHLVAQDGFYVGCVAVLAWLRHPGVDPLGLVTLFLCTYEAVVGASLAAVGLPWFAYGLAFGLGLAERLDAYSLFALTVALALYAVAWVGLRRSLRDLHNWELDTIEAKPWMAMTPEKAVDAMRRNLLGWPFEYLSPKDSGPGIRYRDGVMLSLLIGWWSYVLISKASGPDTQRILAFLLAPVILLGVIFARLGVYWWGYLPPISTWGRVVTLRWIIPRYDSIFVAPLLAFAVLVAGLWITHSDHVVPTLVIPMTITAVFLILLNAPPSLSSWRLTGHHRASPTLLAMNRQAELQQIG